MQMSFLKHFKKGVTQVLEDFEVASQLLKINSTPLSQSMDSENIIQK